MQIQITKQLEQNLRRLYWFARTGIALIWIWTAIVSWFIYPQAESVEWLRRLGCVDQTQLLLAAACLFDLAMGIAASLFPSRRLWLFQILLVLFYTLAISIFLPEFLSIRSAQL